MSTLRRLAETAAEHAAGFLKFRVDQSIAIPGLPAPQRILLQQQFPGERLTADEQTWNVVSCAPVAGVGSGRGWLRQGVYADIVEGLRLSTGTRVVLHDPSQPYMPCVGGHFVAMACAREDTWSIRIAVDEGGTVRLPGALRSATLAEAARRVDMLRQQGCLCRADALNNLVDSLGDLMRARDESPAPELSRCEAIPGALVWQELNEGWNARWVQSLCLYLLNHGVTSVGITQTRHLVVSGLSASHQAGIDEIGLRHRIRLGMNAWQRWMLVEPALEKAAEELAHCLASMSSLNPGYSISLQGRESPHAETQVIVRPVAPRGWHRRKSWHLEFKSPTGDGKPSKEATSLLRAAESIVERIEQPVSRTITAAQVEVAVKPVYQHQVHRCLHCQTEYDDRYGDPMSDTPVGTKFEELPSNWECPVCGGAAKDYRTVDCQTEAA